MTKSPDQFTSATGDGVRAIAFYLPQFHPIPENDAWWGRGFTEWTNVTRARPLFKGHHQPHLPTELGFYDLRLPETRAAQAELAEQYGIHGFCYYYYSFGEKRLLERPLLDMVESGKPDFPFCICWANETWSRRWDGAESQILIAQDDSLEHYRSFVHEVLPILKDRRYIRVAGAPVLLVYRVGRIPDARSVAAYWREQAVAAGLPGLYLCGVQSHDPSFDPRAVGFDAAVEFPPSPWWGKLADVRALEGLDRDFTGSVFDYPAFSTKAMARPAPDYRLLRAVMTAWDNTARRGMAAYLFQGSSPREYEGWLRGATAWTLAHNPPAERLVFINAWNEWAEGTHLEPDDRYGRAWLEATQRALARAQSWRIALAALREERPIPSEVLKAYGDDLWLALERLDRVEAKPVPPSSSFMDGWPSVFDDKPVKVEGTVCIEALQGHGPCGKVELTAGDALKVEGWAVAPGLVMASSPGVLLLRSTTGSRVYTALLPERRVRHDVAYQHRQLAPASVSPAGFTGCFDTGGVEPGEYKLGVLHAGPQHVVAAFSEHRVVFA